jgi:hypothetical protein
MLLKVMGLMDLYCAIILLVMHFANISWTFGFLGMTYMFIKAYFFRGDFASFIDGAAGIYFIFAMFGLTNFLTWIFFLYLLQKGAVSSFSPSF